MIENWEFDKAAPTDFVSGTSDHCCEAQGARED